MLFDPTILLRQPLAVLGVLAVVVAAGLAATAVVATMGRLDRARATLLAGALPQIGEFSFLLAGLAVSLGVLTSAAHSLIVGAAILSIALNPLVAWATSKLFPAPQAAPKASS
jgi:CPA2 family monovalent cation:H+ antiporter-2